MEQGTGVNTTILRRKQIDRAIQEVPGIAKFVVPHRGWISEVRRIIGMRGDQLAARMHITQSTVSELERAEADGAITLNSLRRAAAAMNCRLTYAFIPEERSFEQLVRSRATKVARELTAQIGHTMALEDQATGAHTHTELLQEAIAQFIRDLPRELWDEQP